MINNSSLARTNFILEGIIFIPSRIWSCKTTTIKDYYFSKNIKKGENNEIGKDPTI